MILSNTSIRWLLDHDELVIRPLPEIIQPTSVDLHLGTEFITDMGDHVELKPEQAFIMGPGDFLLAATVEWIELPIDLVGILMGKSTLARLGLQVEAAGYVDPKWRGNLTLELKNMSTIRRVVLEPGMKICQIRFEQLYLKPSGGYGDPQFNSHYQDSEGPVLGDRHGLYAPRDRFDPDRQ